MRLTTLAIAATLAFAAPAYAATEITPLVNTDWLAAHGSDDNVVILDIRNDIENTDLGELPYIANAVLAPYATAGWRTEIDGVPGKVPPAEDIASLIGGLGISNDDYVVIIPWGTDSSEFGAATRVYWTFKYLGHDQVAILDGGWRQYSAAGGAHVAEPVTLEPTTFNVALRENLLATTEEVQTALANGTPLIDGRPPAQFNGEAKSGIVARSGTLPGAINLPNSEFYSADYARFAQPETVAALSSAIGLGADEQNITFCNTGHWASVVWFGLSEVLGNQNTSMYDGSMAEWAADPSRPMQ